VLFVVGFANRSVMRGVNVVVGLIRSGSVGAAVAFVVAVLLASCSSSPTAQGGDAQISVADAVAGSCGHAHSLDNLTAVTQSGQVVQIEPKTLARQVIAQGVHADGGVALRAGAGQVYVTSGGSNGLPSVWAITFGTCHPGARLIEARAELPSVSPDGGYLGYVTLDGHGRQTGVSIVRLGRSGTPTGAVQHLGTATVPPPLPIHGIAVGVGNRTLAVWGGYVDPYLGRHRTTVGTLNPATAHSLGSLVSVFDGEGISVTGSVGSDGRESQSPKAWQAAPSYLSNGEFLVWTNPGAIVMPFTDSTPGVSGGGIRNILRVSGTATSLAAGPDGSLGWVGGTGRLEIAEGAIDLPLGPGAETPPQNGSPALRRVPGTYTSVAWSTGASAQATRLPPVFRIIHDLPSVVGMSEAKAQTFFAHLALPVFVSHTQKDPSVPPDTVLAQNPPAGDGVACQCAIGLIVSTKG
jgi:hypothetical protein